MQEKIDPINQLNPIANLLPLLSARKVNKNNPMAFPKYMRDYPMSLRLRLP